MIKHIDVPSTAFRPVNDLYLLKPRELPKGEVQESGFIVEMEQNTSVVDRPSLGKVIAIGPDAKEKYLNKTLIWEERAGQDLVLQDGNFLIIGEEAILGTIEGIDDVTH